MGDKEIKVDVDALNEVVHQMALITAALEEAGSDYKDAFADALGADDLQDRFNAFINGWRDGRKRITGDCNNLGGMVAGALEAYLENETNIETGANDSADQLQCEALPAGGS